MNIYNFKHSISSTVLDKGYDYYASGNILETYDQGDNEYSFLIEGSEYYEVVVKIDENGDVLYSDCDCPYDFGPVCKHQVAAYYEIQDILRSRSSNKEYKKGGKKLKIEEVLENLTKEELITIIIDIAKKDEVLEGSIIFRYTRDDNGHQIKKCKERMDAIVSQYTHREGFISYSETMGFVNEMYDLIERARSIYEDSNNPILAVDIALMVLEEAIDAFQYADDSYGYISSFIIQIFELIEDIVHDAKDLDIDTKEKLFNRIFKEIDNTIFDEWEEYQVNLISICAEFMDIKEFREKLKTKLEYLISKNEYDKNKGYSSERMSLILLSIIEEYGHKDEAEEFIKLNLEFSAFRELLIGRLMKEKNYLKVIDVALEGEIKDKQYLGLVLKWKKSRYMAYKELLLKEEQEKLARELLFKGQFEYYMELKKMHQGDQEDFYDNIIKELKSRQSWLSRDVYLKIIVEEKDLDEILKHVSENPRAIEEYSDMLFGKYPEEVIEIFKKSIGLEADVASNRKQYQNVCRKIKRYRKVAGIERVEEIVKELSIKYKRRPALLDELSKI